MWIESAAIAALSLGAPPAPAQDVGVVAQAYDRCMTTYAVRLTRTAAIDSDIYAEATRSCASLKDQLRAAVIAQLPAAQSSEILRAIDSQGESNFMAMLARIRSDRARREGQ